MRAKSSAVPTRSSWLPQARAALLSLPERDGLVFRSKRGCKMSQSRLSGYWSQIRAGSGLQHDFYGATKHYGVHYLKVKLGLPNHDIAEQAGWSESSVEQMVARPTRTRAWARSTGSRRQRASTRCRSSVTQTVTHKPHNCARRANLI
jgi:hypothetical protein